MKLKNYLSERGRGAIAELAKAIGGFSSDISGYIKEESPKPVPPKTCVAIEKATTGKVTRKDLRPEDYWEWWPDLAAPEQELPPIPEELKAVLPQLKNCGRLKDDRAIAQFLNLPPATRSEVFNTTPPNQLITEAICLKAKQALARGPQ